MKNKINWNKVGWRTLQTITCVIFNTSSIITFSNMWIAREQEVTIKDKDGTDKDVIVKQITPFNDDWWDKPLLWTFSAIGWVMTYSFIKLLYRNHREDKQNGKIDKIVDKIMKKGD